MMCKILWLKQVLRLVSFALFVDRILKKIHEKVCRREKPRIIQMAEMAATDCTDEHGFFSRSDGLRLTGYVSLAHESSDTKSKQCQRNH